MKELIEAGFVRLACAALCAVGCVLNVVRADVANTEAIVSGGVLTLNVKGGDTLEYTDALSGLTAIVKNGAGKAYLKLGASTTSTFSGTVTVNEGTVGTDAVPNWGTPSTFTIKSGGAVDLTQASGCPFYQPTNLRNTQFYMEGTGASHAAYGVMYRLSQLETLSGDNSPGFALDNIIKKIELTGDVSFGTEKRWTVNGTVDMKGHTITVLPPSFTFDPVTFVNPGHIVVTGGTATFTGGSTFNGGLANTITMLNNAIVRAWRRTKPLPWTTIVATTPTSNPSSSSAALYADSSSAATQNQWNGDIFHTNGALLVRSTVGTCMTLSNLTFLTTDAYCPANSSLLGPYVRLPPRTVGGGTVFFKDVTVTNSITKTKSEGFDIWCGSFDFTAPGKKHFFSRIGCISTNAYFHDAGDIAIKSGSAMFLEHNILGSEVPPRFIIEGATRWVGPHSWSGNMLVSQQNLRMSCSGPTRAGVFEIRDGAVYTNGVEVGSQGTATLYQRGGQFCWMKGDTVIPGRNVKANGCYAQTGGNCDFWGNFEFARFGKAFFMQHGGTFTQCGGSAAFGHEGHADMYISGGARFSRNVTTQFSILSPYTPASNTVDRTGVTLTVSGPGSIFDANAYVMAQNTQTCDVVINLIDGGIFRAKRLGRSQQRGIEGGGRLYVGFNGGVLRPSLGHCFDAHFSKNWAPDEMVVYDGGAILDSTDIEPETALNPPDYVSSITGNLRAPSGKCIASIALPTSDAFKAAATYYSAPARIRISGAGKCATALVLMDYRTMTPTNIVVTNPGIDYDDNTTATIDSPDGNTTFPCAVTMGTQRGTGGLTKRGPTEIRLYNTASYGGTLRVEEGTLSGYTADGACVFPSGRPLELTGGTLKLGNASYTLVANGLSGYGTLANGDFTVTNAFTMAATNLMDRLYVNASDAKALTFGAGTTFAVEGLDALTEAQRQSFKDGDPYTLATFKNAYAGALPTLRPPDGLGSGWYLRLAAGGKTLQLTRQRGTILLFH